MVSRHYPSQYRQYTKNTRNNGLHKLMTGSLTTDMISPPLSPNCDFDFNHITPQVRQALEYVSNKLQKDGTYLTFAAMRSRPLPIGQGCNLTTIPVNKLSDEVHLTLQKHIRRAAKKFDLCSNWMVILSEGVPHHEYVINRTLRQNDVLFSLEGLTLLNIDRIYLLKQYLNVLSSSDSLSSPSSSMVDHIPDHIYVDSCIFLLRKSMKDTAGRPFTKNFFHCAYDHLSVRDSLLANIAKTYFSKYGHNAILLSKPNTAATKPDSSPKGESKYRPNRPRRSKDRASPSGKRVSFMRKLSPASPCPRTKTPHTASDVTPITRNEWHLLIGEPENLTRQRPVQTT